MEGEEIDTGSHITNGSLNEERNQNDYNEIDNAVKNGQFFFDAKNTKGLQGCFFCDTDKNRVKQGRARWFAKIKNRKATTSDIEYILNTSLMQCLTNAPNIVYPDVVYNGEHYMIQQRIITEKAAKSDELTSAKKDLITFLHGLQDRGVNAFQNKNKKLINIDFDNVHGSDPYAYTYDACSYSGLLMRLYKNKTGPIIEAIKNLSKFDYEKFLKIYMHYIELFKIDKNYARDKLKKFLDRARTYKSKDIKTFWTYDPKKNPQNRDVYDKLDEYCKKDLENFHKFMKNHNNFKNVEDLQSAATAYEERMDDSQRNVNNKGEFIENKSNNKQKGSRHLEKHTATTSEPPQTNECCVKRFFKSLWKKLKGFFFGTKFANNNEAQKNLSTRNSCENQR